MTAKEFDPVAFFYEAYRDCEILGALVPFESAIRSLVAEAAKQQARKDAEIAGRYWAQLKGLEAAHYRHSSSVFNPGAFGINMETANLSRSFAQAIEKESGL